MGKAKLANHVAGNNFLTANVIDSCDSQTGGDGQDETVTTRAAASAFTKEPLAAR